MKLIKIFSAVFAFLLVFFFLQQLLIPKYASSNYYDGALIREYYDEVKDHDILFIGDCEVYENISPVTLWEEYGITSYIRGSAEQLIWNSYYLLEEMLEYETPKAVVFNVLSMKYGEPRSEESNRMTVDDMTLSASKLNAINATMTEEENMLSYIFPILRYHDRWDELTFDDLKYFWGKPDVSVSGFMIQSNIIPEQTIPSFSPLADYTFSEKSYKYLDMITALCREKNIPLVLMKAPLKYPHWYGEWDEQIVDYAEANGLMYINFLPLADEAGLDMTRDTFNGGLNLNVYGAEKLAKYFGKILQEEFSLPDRRDEPDTAARWNEKAALYHRVKEKQLEELEEYGKIQTHLITN